MNEKEECIEAEDKQYFKASLLSQVWVMAMDLAHVIRIGLQVNKGKLSLIWKCLFFSEGTSTALLHQDRLQ